MMASRSRFVMTLLASSCAAKRLTVTKLSGDSLTFDIADADTMVTTADLYLYVKRELARTYVDTCDTLDRSVFDNVDPAALLRENLEITLVERLSTTTVPDKSDSLLENYGFWQSEAGELSLAIGGSLEKSMMTWISRHDSAYTLDARRSLQSSAWHTVRVFIDCVPGVKSWVQTTLEDAVWDDDRLFSDFPSRTLVANLCFYIFRLAAGFLNPESLHTPHKWAAELLQKSQLPFYKELWRQPLWGSKSEFESAFLRQFATFFQKKYETFNRVWVWGQLKAFLVNGHFISLRGYFVSFVSEAIVDAYISDEAIGCEEAMSLVREMMQMIRAPPPQEALAWDVDEVARGFAQKTFDKSIYLRKGWNDHSPSSGPSVLALGLLSEFPDLIVPRKSALLLGSLHSARRHESERDGHLSDEGAAALDKSPCRRHIRRDTSLADAEAVLRAEFVTRPLLARGSYTYVLQMLLWTDDDGYSVLTVAAMYGLEKLMDYVLSLYFNRELQQAYLYQYARREDGTGDQRDTWLPKHMFFSEECILSRYTLFYVNRKDWHQPLPSLICFG